MINPVSAKQHNRINFQSKLCPFDLKYKQSLIKGIQDTFQFSPKIEALDSVLAPVEMQNLLKKFSPGHYKIAKDWNDLFENIKNCKFRVNLHVHTKKSDGSLSPAEYLEQSRLYADKVKKLSKNDTLPPYTSSVTDHNNIEASQEIIAMIAEEPKKYKNFKFIPGCEFLFLDKNNGFKFPAFEAVGLGFNPFSQTILKTLSNFNSIEIIKNLTKKNVIFSYAHPIRYYFSGNGTTPEFIKYLKRIGINGIESNYQYIRYKNTPEMLLQIEHVKKLAKENNFYETGGTDTHGRNIFHTSAQKYIDELLY